MKAISITLYIVMISMAGLSQGQTILEFEKGTFHFQWNLEEDLASVESTSGIVWQGSLLPSFWIEAEAGEKVFVQGEFQQLNDSVIGFSLCGHGRGTMKIAFESHVVQIREVEVTWNRDDTKIISMHYGLVEMDPDHRRVVPDLEEPCWPNWRAEGYCIPTAKGAPIQSFFRFWQFGSATIPLGNFGSSLGTPYAAAFPRPLYAMAMGGSHGWACFGAGQIPDGAMVLQLKTASSSLNYLYREDLWGGSGKVRRWEDPLFIAMNAGAWDAYRELFATLDESSPVSPVHQLNHWNTWGDFKNRRFDMETIVEKAVDFEAEEITWDMSWETFECSGKPNYDRFPDFDEDLQMIREAGLKVGFWQSVLWINDFNAAGLTKSDLICGKDGEPRLVNWINSPYNTNQFHYAVDPSSENAVKFLRDRTRYIVGELGADLLKLDFAYNIPSPDVGVPRDPELRGERYGYTLLKIIADAAREVNPDITLQYYGISPLMHPCYNLIALDDMGDAGNMEKEGHGQWSIWASLAGIQGRAIMASSGYDWDADDEVLLNTAIIGSPGLVLPGNYKGGPIPEEKIALRVALGRWYRRTTGWEPLWLNSHKGSLDQEPAPYCWGRVESPAGRNQKILTALALREEGVESLDRSLINGIDFTGNWALISQDRYSIFETSKLAVIAFEPGFLSIPSARKPDRIVQVFRNKEVEYSGWSYQDATIRLTNDPGFRKKAQCGYLILWD